MLRVLLFALLCLVINKTFTQSFTGTWKGLIERSVRGKASTDSIRFDLQQHSDTVRGFSYVYLDSLHFLKATITGQIIPGAKTVRIVETKLIENTYQEGNNDVILDEYILHYNNISDQLLTGKSIPIGDRQFYTRSMVVVTLQR